MKGTIFKLLAVSSFVALASANWPSSAPAAGNSVRVQGDQPAASFDGKIWTSGKGKIDTALPVGYNGPTPIDAVEIKTYPSVRRADFESNNLWLPNWFGQSRAFWALYDHIKVRKIDMTSPVEMIYRNIQRGFFGLKADSWNMSFLYRNPELGPTGPAEGGVNVVDSEIVTVISVGVEGVMSIDLVQKGVEILNKALASQSTWVVAGDARAFGYNDPFVSYKWNEVQLPIKLRA
jgi:hypothetical protein